MQGALSCFNEILDMTSDISSSVPVPPGKAIKASPNSIIVVFLSVISLVMINSVKPSYCSSSSIKNCGFIPMTSPPASNTLSAIYPINPDFDPP